FHVTGVQTCALPILINALVGRKGLARTSNTPGRTQELNYFVPDGYSGAAGDLPPMALVDMPGYGYAQAPKSQVDAWTDLVFDYRSEERRVGKGRRAR